MKEENRHISIKSLKAKLLVATLISIFVCIVLAFVIRNGLVEHSEIILAPLLALFVFITLGLIVYLLSYISAEREVDKEYKKNEEKIVQSLSTEFTEVKFNSSLSKFDIPDNAVLCTAKLGKDGDVVFHVKVDVEISTYDYELFLKYFEI